MKGAAAALIAVLVLGAYRSASRARPAEAPLPGVGPAPPAAWPDMPASFALPFSNEYSAPAEPLAIAGSFLATPPAPQPPPPSDGRLAPEAERAIVERARVEVERGVQYDAGYWYLNLYPGGDLPPDRGACSDLVVRALRAIEVDLQVLVHEDILAQKEAYEPLKVGDANIDHRRVPTLYVYFVRNGIALPTDVREVGSFRPGDVVFYSWTKCSPGWPCVPNHVALVSDRIGSRGLPLLLQNGGPQAVESDALDTPTVVGHYRLKPQPRLALGGTR